MKQTERWHGQTTNITDSIILNVKSEHMNGTDLGRDKFHYEFQKRPSLVVVYKKSCRISVHRASVEQGITPKLQVVSTRSR